MLVLSISCSVLWIFLLKLPFALKVGFRPEGFLVQVGMNLRSMMADGRFNFASGPKQKPVAQRFLLHLKPVEPQPKPVEGCNFNHSRAQS